MKKNILKNSFFITSLFALNSFSQNLDSPTVAKIFGLNGESCNASFIENSKIITAAHCNLSTYKAMEYEDDDYKEKDEFDESELKGNNYSGGFDLSKGNQGYVVVDNVSYYFISTGRVKNQHNWVLDYSINTIQWEDNIQPSLTLVGFNKVSKPELNSKVFTKMVSKNDESKLFEGAFLGFPSENAKKDRYKFQHSIKTTFGYSGAPIFDEYNNLLSMVSGGLTSTEFDYGPYVNDILEHIKGSKD